MNRFFSALFIVLFINAYLPAVAFVKNSTDVTKTSCCEVINPSGTVCKVSVDKSIVKIDALDSQYLQSTETIVTVDRLSTVTLRLENLRITLKPRTILTVDEISLNKDKLKFYCRILQGELSLETTEESNKEIDLIIDTKSSTIIPLKNIMFKFLVTDTGKVTVYYGTVEICALTKSVGTNFLDKPRQRELLRSVNAGESGFFRYSTQLIIAIPNDLSSNTNSRTPTREPSNLPDNKSCVALPADSTNKKFREKESD